MFEEYNERDISRKIEKNILFFILVGVFHDKLNLSQTNKYIYEAEFKVKLLY
jgi:hypothetical protein